MKERKKERKKEKMEKSEENVYSHSTLQQCDL
jgi:hypothetical protein